MGRVFFLEREAHLPDWGRKGCAGREGNLGATPAKRNFGKGTQPSTPTVPPGSCSPARELSTRKGGAARRQGGPGSLWGRGVVEGRIFSPEWPGLYKVLVTVPLLRLPPPRLTSHGTKPARRLPTPSPARGPRR